MDADAYAVIEDAVIKSDIISGEDPQDYFDRQLRLCFKAVPRNGIAIGFWMSIMGKPKSMQRSSELKTETLRRAWEMVQDPLFGCGGVHKFQEPLETLKMRFVDMALGQACPMQNVASLLCDDTFYQPFKAFVTQSLADPTFEWTPNYLKAMETVRRQMKTKRSRAHVTNPSRRAPTRPIEKHTRKRRPRRSEHM